jgi:hypothetical protein
MVLEKLPSECERVEVWFVRSWKDVEGSLGFIERDIDLTELTASKVDFS